MLPNENYMALATKPIRSKPVRDAANGERCTLEIMDACNGRTDTTVLAHLPDQGGVMGGKVDDLSACFACHACHDVIDGRRDWPEGEKPLADWYMRRAQTQTWRRLHALGVLTIKRVIAIKGVK